MHIVFNLENMLMLLSVRVIVLPHYSGERGLVITAPGVTEVNARVAPTQTQTLPPFASVRSAKSLGSDPPSDLTR